MVWLLGLLLLFSARSHPEEPLGQVLRRHRFQSWLVRRGADVDSVEVGHRFAPSGLRGVRALRPFARGEFLLSIPDALCMTEASARACASLGPVLRALRRGGTALDGQVVLALHLLHERHRGTDSAWAPYIDVLLDGTDQGGSGDSGSDSGSDSDSDNDHQSSR